MKKGMKISLKRYLSILLCIMLTVGLTPAAAFATGASEPPAQSLNYVDLNNWTQHGEGSWAVEDGGRTVRQTLNVNPGFFLSPENYIDKVITGTIKVDTSSDDDMVGFVLGYQQPTDDDEDLEFYYDFILFDWKQKEQTEKGTEFDDIVKTSAEGYTLGRLTGELSKTEYLGGLGGWSKYLWFHVPEKDKFELLGTDYGIGRGWRDFTEYTFKILYTRDRIKILIDDEVIFDKTGSFKEGKFGFYNSSQSGVIYGNVQSAVVAPGSTKPVAQGDRYGATMNTPLIVNRYAGILFNDYDPNLDTYTIELVTGPIKGTFNYLNTATGAFEYIPKPDATGTDSFTYKLVEDKEDGEESETVTVEINIIDGENHAPTDIILSDTLLDDDRANGTVVGTLSTVDEDHGDFHDYMLINNAGGRFSIIDNQIVINNSSLINSGEVYNIQVRSTDFRGLSADKDFNLEVPYKVVFKDYNGTALKTEYVRGGNAATAPDNPTRAGYTFAGWVPSDFTNITEDLNIIAQYEANTNTQYKVEHYKQNIDANGYVLSETENLAGTTDAIIAATPKDYIGFTENTSHSNRLSSGEVSADGSLTLKLYYDRNTYTVRFNTNEGSGVSDITGVRYEGKITPPAVPFKEGHIFLGWYKEAELVDIWNFTADRVLEDTTLFAKWISTDSIIMTAAPDSVWGSKSFREVFLLNINNDTVTGSVYASDISLGGVFSGLRIATVSNTDTSVAAEVYGSLDSEGTGIITLDDRRLTISVSPLSANVTVGLFGVAYDGNGNTGGSIPNDGSRYAEEETVTVFGNVGALERNGYVFTGWNTEADGSEDSYETGDTFNMGSADVTLYARWIPATYAIEAIDNQTMAVLGADYGAGTQETKVIAITKAGTGNLTNLAVALSGTDADAFIITQPADTVLNESTPHTTFTVRAKTSLAAGTYTAVVTVSADNMHDEVFTINQVINVPAAPIIQSAIAGDSRVTINWSPVSGADGYKIFASTASDVFASHLGTVSSSVYSYDAVGLTNGTTYYFVVRTIMGSSESENSNEINATPQVPAPGAPVVQSAISGDGLVHIRWSPIIGSTGYQIFTSTISATYDTPAATVAGSVYEYDIAGLDNGTAYYFAVKAINPGGVSSYSNEVIAMPGTFPEAPTSVTAIAGNGQATVTFTAPSDDGGYPVTGYIATSNPGSISASGKDTSITITGLTNSISYTFVVQAVNEIGNSPESEASNAVTPYKPSSGGGSKIKEPVNAGKSGTDILVNGKVETAATTTTVQKDDKTFTTIKIDDDRINQMLEKESSNVVVTIPVNNNANVVAGILNGQTVKSMEEKEAVLEIKTANVTYTLPASQLNINAVSEQIGERVELKDIVVSVKISEPTADTIKVIEDTVNKNNYQIVAKPVEFEITCSSGSKTVEVSKFNTYVERMIAIPEGIDPSRITTGAVFNSDGTFSHVPTVITIIDGKYYAKINSLTNSVYSLISSPKTFMDAENHWAKEAINDMASRLVISGGTNGLYAPDRDITRAEFTAIVVRALGLMRPGTGNEVFNDVTKNDWYHDAVSIAYEYGIISGYGNGEFRPMDRIAREQAMTIIARAMSIARLKEVLALGETDKLLAGFGDGTESEDYAKDSIAACIKTGIISGRNGKLIAPKDNITRAEVAVIVRKLLQKSRLI